MTHLRRLKKVSVFLILLLLSNSSLALEVMTHDSHQHADSQLSQHEMHGVSNAMPSTPMPDSVMNTMQHGEDDCVCDDICCVSSVDFGLTISDDHPPPVGSEPVANANFYRSIDLDLFLPPPTR